MVKVGARLNRKRYLQKHQIGDCWKTHRNKMMRLALCRISGDRKEGMDLKQLCPTIYSEIFQWLHSLPRS